eukprot:6140057-Prymnesium_polylepis.1
MPRCHNDTRPWAAFLVVGHARTFVLEAVARDMLSNAIRSFEAHAATFFVLSDDDHGSTKAHEKVHNSERAVAAAAATFKPVAFRYDAIDSARPRVPKDCALQRELNGSSTLGSYASDQPWLLAWWQTWDRLRSAFQLVVAHEAAREMRFDWVVRLRPDAWFFLPGFAYCQLDPAEGVFSPSGIAGCHGPCMNDHLAW